MTKEPLKADHFTNKDFFGGIILKFSQSRERLDKHLWHWGYHTQLSRRRRDRNIHCREVAGGEAASRVEWPRLSAGANWRRVPTTTAVVCLRVCVCVCLVETLAPADDFTGQEEKIPQDHSKSQMLLTTWDRIDTRLSLCLIFLNEKLHEKILPCVWIPAEVLEVILKKKKKKVSCVMMSAQMYGRCIFCTQVKSQMQHRSFSASKAACYLRILDCFMSLTVLITICFVQLVQPQSNIKDCWLICTCSQVAVAATLEKHALLKTHPQQNTPQKRWCPTHNEP